MARLIYVSNNAISSTGMEHPFLSQEKEVLNVLFGAFDIVSPSGVYSCDSNDVKKVYATNRITKAVCSLQAVFDKEVYVELFRMLREKQFSFSKLIRVFLFAGRGHLLEKLIKKSQKSFDKETVLYSYWLSFDAYAIARVKKKFPEVRSIARAHSYELQLHRNIANPYLMKHFICDNLDRVAFISENSMNDFLSYFGEKRKNFSVQYIGSSGKSARHIIRRKSKELNIVSCSNVLKIKRLDVIINALKDWNICQVKWIHIGDGPDMERVSALAENLLNENKFVQYEFLGKLPNDVVMEQLMNEKIDLFINSSESEGVPISIMEAMSVGLPVIAPHINGIPELVPENCGYLFPTEEKESGLKTALEEFAGLSEFEIADMGKQAFEYWEKHFCLNKNDLELFEGVLL